jgi:predicted nucleic acid-binding protein
LIVIDASLTVAWLLEEESSNSALRLDALFEREPLVVPPHWWAEVGNAFVVNVRRGRIPRDRMEILVERLATLQVQIEPPRDVGQIIPFANFAGGHGLTFYDAAYLQIALERAIPLGTLDRDMRAAAAQLNIPLLPAAMP